MKKDVVVRYLVRLPISHRILLCLARGSSFNTTIWCEVTKNDVYYHHTDHLGTTEVITDSNGNIVWHADYEAFGSVMNERGEENFTPNYTGKFFDESSGLYYFNARWYDCELGRFTTQDPARDGVNWYGYAGQNPINNIDLNGLEVWNSSTLTHDVYNKNYHLQTQYSWEHLQQHFSNNPNGIVYRYDTIQYSLGTSKKQVPNMEKPSAEIAYFLVGFSKTIGTKISSWIKNGIVSAFGSGVVDTTVQLTNMTKNENLSFNTTELFNASVGGFVSGFVSKSIISIPGGNSPSGSILLSNAVGGFSGSMTSQLLYNFQNGESLSEGMGNAYMYGAAGGLMVGGLNICFPTPLPGNIGQILRDSIKEEIVNTATGQIIEEKINETH